MRELVTVGGHEEWYRDVPRSIRRHAIFGATLMLVAFGGFGAWAFRAPLAAAVISQGSFVATGQNKIVQHLEGGIIKEILVTEGARVDAGQVLLRLDETASLANDRELQLRQHRLEATEARLLAEYAEDETLVFPAHLEAMRRQHELDAVLASQTLAFNVSRRALAQDLTLLLSNSDALEVRKVGYDTQLDSHRRQLVLLQEEHAVKAELFAKGLTRRPEVIAVERVMVEAEGQIGRLEAEIAEINEIRRKYEVQIEKARSEYREAALDELQVVQAELESIREKARKAQNVLERSEVVAPVSGTVVRLHYHTAGGVIETGKAILEILPSDEPLIIETLIPRSEIDSVRTGQHATVRLTALNQRTTPVLDGEVFYLSADAIAESANGDVREVYIARVSLEPDQIARVSGFTPTPGMPAEIMIQTEERTFAQYLAKPIADACRGRSVSNDCGFLLQPADVPQLDRQGGGLHFDSWPFGLVPNTDILFWTDAHRQAADVLREGIEHGSPIVLLTGETGSGKTTLVHDLLADRRPDLTIGLLPFLGGGRNDFCASLLRGFGQQDPGSTRSKFPALQAFATAEHDAGRRCVLVVDEAQCAADDELEFLRLLTNLDAGRHRLLQVALVGQPALRTRLGDARHASLAARIGADAHLSAMSEEETARYVLHRLTSTGGRADAFTPARSPQYTGSPRGPPQNQPALRFVRNGSQPQRSARGRYGACWRRRLRRPAGRQVSRVVRLAGGGGRRPAVPGEHRCRSAVGRGAACGKAGDGKGAKGGGRRLGRSVTTKQGRRCQSVALGAAACRSTLRLPAAVRGCHGIRRELATSDRGHRPARACPERQARACSAGTGSGRPIVR